MDNGSDLRGRVVALEQRAAAHHQSLVELIGIVDGAVYEFGEIVGELNAWLMRTEREKGIDGFSTRGLGDLQQRLGELEKAMSHLRPE